MCRKKKGELAQLKKSGPVNVRGRLAYGPGRDRKTAPAALQRDIAE